METNPILVYLNDTLIEGYFEDIYIAAEYILVQENRGLMDTPAESYAYFKDLLESGDLNDWRLVEDETYND